MESLKVLRVRTRILVNEWRRRRNAHPQEPSFAFTSTRRLPPESGPSRVSIVDQRALASSDFIECPQQLVVALGFEDDLRRVSAGRQV
jgi:hypothetical protein